MAAGALMTFLIRVPERVACPAVLSTPSPGSPVRSLAVSIPERYADRLTAGTQGTFTSFDGYLEIPFSLEHGTSAGTTDLSIRISDRFLRTATDETDSAGECQGTVLLDAGEVPVAFVLVPGLQQWIEARKDRDA
jgi:hypothetical protein